jgi:hypothetical protein
VGVLTFDNPLLPRPKNAVNPAAGPFAVGCKSVPDCIADLVRESLAPNTRTAYLADLAHFENWGGRIPAEPETVAAYLATHADALSVATLNRRLAALAKVHRSHGVAIPGGSRIPLAVKCLSGNHLSRRRFQANLAVGDLAIRRSTCISGSSWSNIRCPFRRGSATKPLSSFVRRSIGSHLRLMSVPGSAFRTCRSPC